MKMKYSAMKKSWHIVAESLNSSKLSGKIKKTSRIDYRKRTMIDYLSLSLLTLAGLYGDANTVIAMHGNVKEGMDSQNPIIEPLFDPQKSGPDFMIHVLLKRHMCHWIQVPCAKKIILLHSDVPVMPNLPQS